MKKIFWIFLLLVVVLAPRTEAGGTLKIVTGTVMTSKAIVPADGNLSFEAYVLGREGDTLHQNSAGCGYSAGSWWITVSNFTGAWAIGEILRISFHDAESGESNKLEVALDGSTTQDTGDFSLPVELSFFTATFSFDGVKILWRTESEVENLGFNIYRGNKKEGPFIKINQFLIKGAGNSVALNEYQFIDESSEPGKTYFYYLEDVGITGQRGKSKIIKVVTRHLAATWGKIKQP